MDWFEWCEKYGVPESEADVEACLRECENPPEGELLKKAASLRMQVEQKIGYVTYPECVLATFAGMVMALVADGDALAAGESRIRRLFPEKWPPLEEVLYGAVALLAEQKGTAEEVSREWVSFLHNLVDGRVGETGAAGLYGALVMAFKYMPDEVREMVEKLPMSPDAVRVLALLSEGMAQKAKGSNEEKAQVIADMSKCGALVLTFTAEREVPRMVEAVKVVRKKAGEEVQDA